MEKARSINTRKFEGNVNTFTGTSRDKVREEEVLRVKVPIDKATLTIPNAEFKGIHVEEPKITLEEFAKKVNAIFEDIENSDGDCVEQIIKLMKANNLNGKK